MKWNISAYFLCHFFCVLRRWLPQNEEPNTKVTWVGQNDILRVGIPSRSNKFKPSIHTLERLRYENVLLDKNNKTEVSKHSTQQPTKYYDCANNHFFSDRYSPTNSNLNLYSLSYKRKHLVSKNGLTLAFETVPFSEL